MNETGDWKPGIRVLQQGAEEAAKILRDYTKAVDEIRTRAFVRHDITHNLERRETRVVTHFADGSREERVETPDRVERWTYTPRVVDEAQGIVQVAAQSSPGQGLTIVSGGELAWAKLTPGESGQIRREGQWTYSPPAPADAALAKRVDRVRAYYAKKLGRSVEQLRADRIGEGRWDQPALLAELEAQIDAEERREDFWSMADAALWGFVLIGSALAGVLFYAAATGV